MRIFALGVCVNVRECVLDIVQCHLCYKSDVGKIEIWATSLTAINITSYFRVERVAV